MGAEKQGSCVRLRQLFQAHLTPCTCLPVLPTPHYDALQDEAVRLGAARRGVERGAAEKKIAILEKALSQNPGSDELLLALLQAVSVGRGPRHACMRCAEQLGTARCRGPHGL